MQSTHLRLDNLKVSNNFTLDKCTVEIFDVITTESSILCFTLQLFKVGFIIWHVQLLLLTDILTRENYHLFEKTHIFTTEYMDWSTGNIGLNHKTFSHDFQSL